MSGKNLVTFKARVFIPEDGDYSNETYAESLDFCHWCEGEALAHVDKGAIPASDGENSEVEEILFDGVDYSCDGCGHMLKAAMY